MKAFSRSASHTAFTLTEILVVVTIIGLLAGLSFPLVGAAQRKAWMAADVQKMRAIGVAMAAYAGENDGRIPNPNLKIQGTDGGAGNRWTWHEAVDRYFDQLDSDTLVNPQVIIEVLSPSTERSDRGAKFRHYQQCPSIQEVVLVAQDRIQVDRFVRPADGNWLLSVSANRAAQFSLTTVPVSFPVADIYARVDMPTESAFQPGPVAEAR